MPTSQTWSYTKSYVMTYVS
ncbi:hypothetical protein F383_03823 [Gossypium arboreum]|uniref:Uncharacterized protein n=1 Tax=Gossypium arboreum TaxID=29729 RepID=A0A0B0P883_GOSAR|nr:hypothetical protein F383_03823 [Gossypium arboreum]